MSRSKKKLAIIHDLQCKHGDIILTKKDIRMIMDGLLAVRDKYSYEYMQGLYKFLINLMQI